MQSVLILPVSVQLSASFWIAQHTATIQKQGTHIHKKNPLHRESVQVFKGFLLYMHKVRLMNEKEICN